MRQPRGLSVVVTSVSNPRIVEARKLGQRKHRERQGRFLVEGLQLLHMALDGGALPLEVFYCPDLFAGTQAPDLLQRMTGAGAAVVEVAPPVLGALSEREEPQGLVAAFALPEGSLDSLDPGATDRGLVVVLDRLQDPGNLGTIIRTADAVGAAAVILIEPCVDPYDPKTVRGSMGSLFNVPVVRTAALPALAGWLRDRGLRVVGADAHLGEEFGDGLLHGGVALVLGNEARGLSPDVRPLVEAWARLPIVGRAESLNVAVAGGVLMYGWLRANRRPL
ncbi:MAG: RNA methyltransferase [Bacillota bacterium]|nr:RNA methyltransferase [Bacillota bacterium]